MCTGGIAWCAFDWQSFATLVTGALAVFAAVCVSRKQTEIQKRQTDLQEASLRSNLFDRRYRIFERAEHFLREILRESDDPSTETHRDFVIATGEARFLFKENVHEGLREIFAKWADFHALKVRFSDASRMGHSLNNGEAEQEAALLEWFMNRFTTLPDLFDELKLGGEIAPR